MVWHEKFGWLAKANVPRYEQGERLSAGRWVSEEADARRTAASSPAGTSKASIT